MPLPENFLGFFFSKDTNGDMLYDNSAEEIIDISLKASETQPGSQAFYIAAAVHDLIANNLDSSEEIVEKTKILLKKGNEIKPDAPWMDIVNSGMKLRQVIRSGKMNPGLMAVLSHGIQAYAITTF